MGDEGEFKFNCDKCDFHVNAKSLFDKHLSTVKHKTGVRAERSDKRQRTKCEFCNHIPSNGTNMKLHMLNKHSTLEERKKAFAFYCEFCNCGVLSQIAFKNHTATRKHKYFVNQTESNNKNNTGRSDGSGLEVHDIDPVEVPESSDSDESTNSETVGPINPDQPESIKQLESPESIKQLESPESIKQLESPESIKQLESPESIKQLESPESIDPLESPESIDPLESPESIKPVELITLFINPMTPNQQESINE